MNTRRSAAIVLWLLVLASALPAAAQNGQPAQGPRPKPEMTAWWDQPIVRDLGLTEQQNSQIRATVAESRSRLLQLKNGVDAAEKALRELMDQQSVDIRRAEAAADQVVSTHAEMMRAVTLMSIRLRAILTYPQWEQLQRRESQPPPPLPGQPQGRRPQED